MKFSDFDRSSWEENGKYYDTCLIPYTGLTGKESPPQTADRLGQLRDAIYLVERPFKGRIVVYPAVQYNENEKFGIINEICHNIKSNNFRYVVVLDGVGNLLQETIFESDLIIAVKDFFGDNKDKAIALSIQKIQQMWQENMS
ncbi:DUF2487 family protein [Paenibacillus sabinae]|uniref:DUF2487 domain-containing protein n=1 Tax=Paenibacillus sabinae T27 TaxID=1268072 RepID=X4ZN74_9BACL|nr:DUF2487 family protein [Paenibacillus sabinae]AHV98065.1 hypothetical protein PSAB_15790 [Paenibacillus sabinae T27]